PGGATAASADGGAGAARRQNPGSRFLRFALRFSPEAVGAIRRRQRSYLYLVQVSFQRRTGISLNCTANYMPQGGSKAQPCRAKSHAQCGQTRFLNFAAAPGGLAGHAKSLNKND